MAKIANFRRFLGIGVSATFAEYSAEYSVFCRTLNMTKAERGYNMALKDVTTLF